MEAVIVTGGAGFIGANYVRHALAHSGDLVVALDKLTYAGNLESLAGLESNPRFRFVQGDIGDSEAVKALLREHRPRAIVNLAAETHVDRSIDGPRAFVETNVLGTFALLEAIREYLAGLDPARRSGFRLLHVSTDEVYGSLGPSGAFTEATPYSPNSPYAASKAAADHLVRAYHETYGLPTLVTNCSNNFGPYQFPEKLIPLMILNAVEGKPLPIYGDGGNVRDWLYVEDHCAGLASVLERGKPGEKYNIGAGNERNNRAVVQALCEILEELLPSSSNPALLARGQGGYANLQTFVQDRPGHDRRYAIDATRLRSELGWSPVHDFASGLRRTVSWYLENAEWSRSVQSGSYRRERLGLSKTPEPRGVR